MSVRSFEEAGLSSAFVQTLMCDETDDTREGLTTEKADAAIAILLAESGHGPWQAASGYGKWVPQAASGRSKKIRR